MRAVAIAWNLHPELRVVLLGDGPERKHLEALAQELGIADRVTFMGQVPFDQVPDYLKSADLFGFASTTETQGLVTMEALASNLPVVAVDASGTRDIVKHEIQGLLVEEEVGALANGIDHLIANENRYQQYKAAAQARAKDFEISTLAETLVQVYEQAIEDNNAGKYVQVRQQEPV